MQSQVHSVLATTTLSCMDRAPGGPAFAFQESEFTSPDGASIIWPHTYLPKVSIWLP